MKLASVTDIVPEFRLKASCHALNFENSPTQYEAGTRCVVRAGLACTGHDVQDVEKKAWSESNHHGAPCSVSRAPLSPSLALALSLVSPSHPLDAPQAVAKSHVLPCHRRYGFRGVGVGVIIVPKQPIQSRPELQDLKHVEASVP